MYTLHVYSFPKINKLHNKTCGHSTQQISADYNVITSRLKIVYKLLTRDKTAITHCKAGKVQ